MPAISVIVPVYNVEKYIHRCVDSVLAQTFSDFELILVDDGSPDRCGAICDDYTRQDHRIRVIHQKNGGLSAARNAGIGDAKGEYLFFLDSDDVIHPDCLHILMACIHQTGADIALGEFVRFQGMSVPAEQFSPWDKQCLCRGNLETLNCFFDGRDSLHSLVSACGKLWRRDLFEEIRFPLGRLFEDEFTTYKLYYRAEKIAFTDTVVYFYFVNNSGITGSLTLEKRFDEYDAQWERMHFFREHHLTDLLSRAALTFLKTAQWDLITCRSRAENYNPKKRKRFEDQYQKSFKIAEKCGILDFVTHYDYYVLAQPQNTLFWRIKRQILLRLGRKE